MMADSEREKMLRGELFCAFTPDMVAARSRCKYACNRFNNTSDEVPRRRLVELWREYVYTSPRWSTSLMTSIILYTLNHEDTEC